jgi:DNA-binding FadR family transcriptional regulator
LHIQVAESHLSASIIEAARPNDLDELIEVLRARRAIEHEAAKLAALRATTEDLKEISWALSQHRQVVIRGLDPSGAGLDFHITVANASKNHFMSSMIKLLTYEERFIEQRIEVLSTLELASENVDMHEQILQALINRDSELASKLMEDHLQHLIDLVQLDSTNFPDKIVKNKRVSST